MEKRVVCQMSYLPLGDAEGMRKVKKVLGIIKDSGLEFTICKLSTTVTAEKEEIFKLVNKIYDELKPEGNFVFDMRITSFYE
ncbi:MAG: YkoF family thiamine/hydroxymethylpyrimidine-binding protein [Eubacteriaceae bacterium]